MDLTSLVIKYQGDMVSTMRMSCAEVSIRVVSRTPVDEGSARASWTVNKGAPIAKNIDVASDNGTGVRNSITAVANSLQPGDTYSFANGQPYIRPLEYLGWSGQAPQGMLRVSVAEWGSIVKDRT